MYENEFYIDKWYLDFTSEDNEVWIFYAAKLHWHGLVVPYTAVISGHPERKSIKKSRYHHVNIPDYDAGIVTWQDKGYNIQGEWKCRTNSVAARLYGDDSGYLDWYCHMPSGRVKLKVDGKEMMGNGYVEQLKITIPPWKIPIDELRWGRFISEDSYIVWVDFKNGGEKKWMWHNGKSIDNCTISDNHLRIGAEGNTLSIEKIYDIEKEQSISKVVERLIKYLPGFKKAVPLKFLFAQNCKWYSKGELSFNAEKLCTGNVIHELVEFKHSK